VKIAELSVSVVRIPLRRPIRHASHRRTETDPFIDYFMAHTATGQRLLEELRRANEK